MITVFILMDPLTISLLCYGRLVHACCRNADFVCCLVADLAPSSFSLLDCAFVGVRFVNDRLRVTLVLGGFALHLVGG